MTRWVAMAAALAACSGGSGDGTFDTAPAAGEGAIVTLGVFVLEGDDYVDQNADLVIEVGVPCYSWSRSARADQHSDESHDHFNAADATRYDGVTFTWTEYGPELSQAEIDDTCAAGSRGATKSATADDYTADKDFFLRIKSVEE